MTKEEAKQELWATRNINTLSKVECDNLLNKIYDDLESRNCTNCKWYKNEVCVNDESRLCADFVSDRDICKLWESKVS